MPRRHPKKPPKDLDLSHHFRLLTEIETPFDPTALFLSTKILLNWKSVPAKGCF